ncbi:MAG: phosphate transport system substrate-binding protein [Puniceicoccaceae bacterium 5H]|nr:MAG: phosphate transport system substrate-binding protein [Puniceicoccaceae bacterium 5H]
MYKTLLSIFACCLALPTIWADEPVQVDEDLPVYEKVSGVSGTLSSVGSDTLNNMMALWVEAFQAIYPNVKIQVEGKGSSTAPPALIEGTAQLGPMSREMKSTEIDDFQKEFGYKPTKLPVAIDSLAVYTNKDNPIKGLTLQQVDSVFSSTYKRNGSPAKTWGDLGLEGSFASRPISLYGRNSASGTYGFFKEHVMLGGDYSPSVKEQPGSSAVVQGVANDLYGIGYSGIGYKTSGVNAIALAGPDGTMYEPTYENCVSGDYPLSRFLYIYVNKSPRGEMDTLTQEFLKFVLSKQGQEIVIRDGYYPLPAFVVEEVRANLLDE